MRKYFSRILITAGLIIMGIALYQKVTTIYYQNKLVNEYDEYINTLKSQEINEIEKSIETIKVETNDGILADNLQVPEIEETKEINNSEENNNEEPEDTENSKPDLVKLFENKEISGIIEIPKINVSAAILEGTDDSALKYAVGHYPGTVQPGENGNSVLLGHRNYLYGHFFRKLDELETGDKVVIKKDENIYTYVIYESFVVKPEDTWVLDQTSDSIITMITCTPIGTYTDRLIVRGALLEEKENLS
jgi:sortase A